MNDCSAPQAPCRSFLFRHVSTAFNLDRSAIRTFGLILLRPLTTVMRSAVCSAAPWTWTLKLHEDWLVEESAAVQVTVVSPIWKVLPEAGEQVTAATAQLSETGGA